VLKTVLEDAKGSRLEGISFGDVKADLHYTESKDTVCLLYYPEINEFQGRRTVQAVIESWRYSAFICCQQPPFRGLRVVPCKLT